MKLHIKELILDEILEQYLSGDKNITQAYNRAQYAFRCYKEESEESCQETFNATWQDVYDAYFDMEDITMSEIIQYISDQGHDEVHDN